VSGGQTGADRAALDAALAAGVPYGGWCPRGGWAEDLPVPPGVLARYPRLRPTPDRDPRTRTLWNVRDSDASLVLRLAGDVPSAGTRLTVATAERLGRPVLVAEAGDVGLVLGWLAERTPATLNVAGPRESEQPGLYAAARRTLEVVLTRHLA
jgi:hypothetical protein